MKNRGVEIFMGPLDEINKHDKHSLLELQGIHDKTIRNILLEIHTIVKNLVPGLTIGINYLLRSSYLVSQNIQRGQPIKPTILKISIDTYGRCLNENLKQNAISEISKLLEENPKNSNEFLCPNVKTVDVVQSSHLCYIKRQCNILEQHKNLYNTSIEDLLLCYFGRSSSSDINIRSQWLLLNLKFDDEAYNSFVKLPPNLEFDMLHFNYTPLKYIDSKDLPYDLRYLPAIYYNKDNSIPKHTPLAENKIHLMLDHALNQTLDKNFAPKKLKSKSKFANISFLIL